jgi:hypothetical protein
MAFDYTIQLRIPIRSTDQEMKEAVEDALREAAQSILAKMYLISMEHTPSITIRSASSAGVRVIPLNLIEGNDDDEDDDND